MEYSVILSSHSTGEKEWDVLQQDLELFRSLPECRQIIVSVPAEWIVKLSRNNGQKMQLAPAGNNLYASLLNAMKAIVCDEVLVADLKKPVKEKGVQAVVQALQQVPSVWYSPVLQGFDTRLVMFCLQYAIESSLEISTYIDAVEKLADMPVTRLQETENGSED